MCPFGEIGLTLHEIFVVPLQISANLYFKIKSLKGDLQDGGGVRRGDHLLPHKYIRNTSTGGTTPTDHLLNTGRRPQTSQKARKYPRTWIGQKKKEKTEAKE